MIGLWRAAGVLLLVQGALTVHAKDGISLDELIEYRPNRGERVRWTRNSRALLIATAPSRDVVPENRIVPVRGKTSFDVGPGRHAAISPDGRTVLMKTEAGWELHFLESPTRRIKLEFNATPAGEIFQAPEWSADGRYVAVSVVKRFVPSGESVPTEQAGPVRYVDLEKARRARHQPFATIVNLIDADNGRLEAEWSLPGTGYQLRWANGNVLYVCATRGWDSGKDPITTDVFRLTAGREVPETVLRIPGFMQQVGPAPSPDGRWLALAIDADNRKWDDFVSLSLMDLRTGELKRLTRTVYVTGGQHAWATDSSRLYFIGRQGGYDQIFTVDLNGAITQLSRAPRRHFDLRMAHDGHALSYQTEDGYGRREVRILELKGATERVVQVIVDPTRRFKLGEFRTLSWSSFDGLPIHGYAIFPHDFDPQKKYPLLVDVHSGGPSSYLYLTGPLTTGFSAGPLEWHVWASLGYVVLVPDYRSSGEYGVGVAAARYAALDYLESDARDVEHAAAWFAQKSFIDRERLGLIGFSAGGGRSHWLLTRSELFAAAVLIEPTGAGHQESVLIATSGPWARPEFETNLRHFIGASMREKPEAYKTGFLFDGHKVTTPTLILMGGELGKFASPVASTEVLFSMMQQYEVPSRHLRYVGEGHNFASPAVVRHAFGEMQDWFERHLRAR